MTVPAATHDVVQAYRLLLRACLHAVKYSKPARYVLTDRLRYSFRNSPGTALEQRKLDRTLEFLDGAAKEQGCEHRLLRNLAHYWSQKRGRRGMKPGHVMTAMVEARRTVHQGVDAMAKEMGRTLDIYVGQSADTAGTHDA